MRQQRGATPTNALDTVTKGYVDGRTPTLLGTTAERDAYYGTATPPSFSQWFNTDMAWQEVYFPAFTQPSDVGRPAGWFPISGAVPSFEANNAGAAQSIPNATTTVLSLSSTALRGGFTTVASGTGTGFVTPLQARYAISITVVFASAANGNREVSVRYNNTTFAAAAVIVGTAATNPTMTAALPTLSLSRNGTIDFRIYHTQGSPLSVTVTRASCSYLGPI